MVKVYGNKIHNYLNDKISQMVARDSEDCEVHIRTIVAADILLR